MAVRRSAGKLLNDIKQGVEDYELGTASGRVRALVADMEHVGG